MSRYTQIQEPIKRRAEHYCHVPSSSELSHSFEAACQQDSGALDELFGFYRPLLLYLADRRLRGPLRPKVGASDIVQVTELNARRNFASKEFTDRKGFHAWLLTILDNQIADMGRRFVSTKKRDVSRERSLFCPETQDWLRLLSARLSTRVQDSNTAESLEQVKAALSCLPAHYQMVLRLRYFDMLGFEAIGERLGRPADAARMLHNRALARLRALAADDQLRRSPA
jgi:RNA polymerase sigma-70 factor (subfamily 1)